MKSIAFIEDTIVKRVEAWVKDVVLFTGAKNLRGEKLTSTPHVYRGFLPIRMTGEIDASLPKKFPCIVVQTMKGHYDFYSGQAEVRMMVDCWDNSDDLSGYQDVVNVIEVLKNNLYVERHIADEFPLAGPVSWGLQQGAELAPTFWGGLTVTLDVETPSSRFDAMLHGG